MSARTELRPVLSPVTNEVAASCSYVQPVSSPPVHSTGCPWHPSSGEPDQPEWVGVSSHCLISSLGSKNNPPPCSFPSVGSFTAALALLWLALISEEGFASSYFYAAHLKKIIHSSQYFTNLFTMRAVEPVHVADCSAHSHHLLLSAWLHCA